MTPGGVQEIIAYFAGYMHLDDDVVRLRDIYLYPAYPGGVGENFVDSGYGHFLASPDDGSASTPMPPSYFPAPAGPIIGVRVPHHTYLSHPEPFHHNLPVPQLVPPDVEPPQIQVAFGESPAASPLNPSDEMINVIQVNGLDAVNYLGVDPDNPAVQAFGADAPLQIEHMLATADAMLPSSFGGLATVATNGGSVVATNIDALALVNTHDTALTAQGAGLGTVALGEYVNGVYDAGYGTPMPDAVIPTTTPAPTGLGEINTGLNTLAGDNFQLNEAGILDNNAEYSNMMVLGNYYSTNAIFQTNTLEDNNHIAVAASGATSNIDILPDLLNNIASFSQQGYSLTSAPGSTSLAWNVSVMNGNFYDVNVVSQINTMNAGGVSLQTEQTSYYQAITGENQQINDTIVNANGQPYDLIIVEGNYQNANIILQNNLVFNESAINASLENGKGASLSLSVGGNVLTNYASIENLGGNQFSSLSPQLASTAQASESGQFQPAVASATEGNGSGALNVLFITGNFYDVNVVSQLNVLSDASMVVQSAAGGSAGTTTSAAASTGANQALNLAQIIDFGASGTQYVGGQIYTDSLLEQANILSQHQSVTNANPHALANEVVAFLGNETTNLVPSASDVPGTGSSLHHHDFIAGMYG